MDVYKVVGALASLQREKGTHPSTREISERAGCAEATGIKYLQRAVVLNLITQRDGHYMTLDVAKAFDQSKEVIK